jgi:MFS transporter, OPA family, glycerol-3-phosphate transporter
MPAASDKPVHSSAYRLRRVANWFPLGLTYATFYMGRYNFNVVKGDMGKMFDLSKTQMGIIATAGFWTYALSVILNGPLADRVGGRRAILIGAVGAAALNLIIGLLFLSGTMTKILVSMSLLYAVNMYFQSFGALSVVKVNSSWFHVRERGVFGGIFGIMISSGYFLAVTVGGWILAHFSWYFIFLIPSFCIFTMFLVDLFMVRDKPSQAGHPDFNTGDASAGDDTPIDWGYLVRKVFTNPIIITLALAEFCTGFVRQGVMLYFTEYFQEVHAIVKTSPLYWWGGFAVTLGGIAGGLACGYLSDRWFHSRRPPVAFIFYMAQIVFLLLLGFLPGQLALLQQNPAAATWGGYTPGQVLAVLFLGLTCMVIFGVHGMLSGTASMDFGGRKAAATTAGMLDGIQYVASGFTGFGLGAVLDHWNWDGVARAAAGAAERVPADAHIWVLSIIPFSLIGGLLMIRLWRATPLKGAVAH